MFKSFKKPLVATALVGLLVAAMIVYFEKKFSHKAIVLEDPPVHDRPLNANTNTNTNTNANESTIAEEWQWPKTDRSSNQVSSSADNEKNLPFTRQSVHDALYAVRLDSEGNVILDNITRVSLDEALERNHKQLDAESLQALQQLIRESLLGIAGEQVAQLVGDYHQFLGAKDEFSEIYEGTENTAADDPLVSLEGDEALYAELQALREVHLGAETANSLFSEADANAEFMFASMKLEYDTTLTAEEKDLKLAEIDARRIEKSINIDGWSERYDSFVSAKQDILTAAISPDEQRQQLSSLLAERFSAEEIDRIKYYGLALDEP